MKSDQTGSYSARLSTSVIINVAAGFLSLGVTLLVFPLYVSRIGTNAFSAVIVALAVVSIVSTVDFGYGQIVVRRSAVVGRPNFKGDVVANMCERRLWYVALLVSSASLLYGFLSPLYKQGGWSAIVVLAVGGALIPIGLRGAQARYEGSLRFAVPRSFLIASSLLRVFVAVTVSEVPSEFRVAIVLVSESSWVWLPAIGCYLSSRVIKATELNGGERDRLKRESWPDLRKFGIGAFVSTSVGMLIWNIDVIASSWFLTAADVIVFGAAVRVVQVYRQAVGWAVAPISSRLHSIHSDGGLVALHRVWMKSHPASVVATASVGFAALGFGALILVHLLPNISGSQLNSAVLVFGLVMASAMVGSGHQIGLQLLIAARRPVAVLPVQIAWAGLKVAAIYLASFAGSKELIWAGGALFLVTLVVEPVYLFVVARTLELSVGDVALRGFVPNVLCAIICLLVALASTQSHSPTIVAFVASILLFLALLLIAVLYSKREALI